jgi:hypothetical protein
VRSIRLNDELDTRVRQAAAVEGASVSEFIRRAASERADHTLATGTSERFADVIGAIHGGGGRARDTGTAFVAALDQRS